MTMEIKYETNYATGETTIWLREKIGATQRYYHFDGEHLVSQERKEGVCDPDVKPFLILPEAFARTFIETMTKFGNEQGMNKEDTNFTQGKLEATESHLKDLQNITKKLLKIE